MNADPMAILRVARVNADALARIGRTYEQHVSGRCDEQRVLEVVRQELHRAGREAAKVRLTAA